MDESLSQMVISSACQFFNVSLDDIKSKRRTPEMVQVRVFIAKYLKDKNFSTTRIGAKINRDHSSIIHELKEFDFYRNYRECFIWEKFVKLLDDSEYYNEVKIAMENRINDCKKSELKQVCMNWLMVHRGLTLTPTLIDQFEMLAIWK